MHDLTVIFPNPEKKIQWEEFFNETKSKMSKLKTTWSEMHSFTCTCTHIAKFSYARKRFISAKKFQFLRKAM